MAGGLAENGKRRQCEASGEQALGQKLEEVHERLALEARNTERSGKDLIAHYLDPDRLPVGKQWSRKHADTQRRLCERFIAPVIDEIECQDITGTTCRRSSTPLRPPARGTGSTGPSRPCAVPAARRAT